MSVLRIKGEDGKFHGIPAIKGEPGKDATVEELELIEEIVMQETAWLVRTAEPDGTPYAFRKMMVMLETPVSVPGFNTVLNGNLSSNLVMNWTDGQEVAEGSIYTVEVLAEIKDGCLTSIAAPAWHNGAVRNTARISYCAVKDTAIAKINFGAQMLPGMIIRIYGVRA